MSTAVPLRISYSLLLSSLHHRRIQPWLVTSLEQRQFSCSGPKWTQQITGMTFRILFHLDWQINNSIFNRPIMARTQILVYRWWPRTRILSYFADGLNQSLASSAVQANYWGFSNFWGRHQDMQNPYENNYYFNMYFHFTNLEVTKSYVVQGGFNSWVCGWVLWCYHSNKTSSAVSSDGTIYLVCSSNFWVWGWNPTVLPFKWNLFSSKFTWYYLFSM